ncbi:hypothetical protein [Streptomyces niveus]
MPHSRPAEHRGGRRHDEGRSRRGRRQECGASKPDFPVPVDVGNATQLTTVKASGSYATVTAWAKGASGWKAQFSTASGRVHRR